MTSREVTRFMQRKFKCCLGRNIQYFEIIDAAEQVRTELLKHRLVIGYVEAVVMRDVSQNPRRQQLAYE